MTDNLKKYLEQELQRLEKDASLFLAFGFKIEDLTIVYNDTEPLSKAYVTIKHETHTSRQQ